MARSPTEKDVSGFSASAALAAKVIKNVVDDDGFIHVFSHLDADGVAAAGIVAKALLRLDARFRVRITQWIEDRIVGKLVADKPDLVIFADLGSGYMDFLGQKLSDFRLVVLDHHQIVGQSVAGCVQVNPHLHGIDGAREVSGSGVAYFVAKALDRENVDTANVAVVGALGDMQDKYDQRTLSGLNAQIVEDAVGAGLLRVEKDLVFFGRETRPIHRMLASSTSPFIPGLTGEEDKSLAFLTGLGIKPKEGDKWRALRDLSDEERKRLCSALADYLVSRGLHHEVSSLIGSVYILCREDSWTPLRDAREFAVLLNAVGRMDRGSLGVAVCMGERNVQLEKANKVLEDYRRTISKYLSWVMEKPERMRELQNIYVVYGEAFINDKIVGAVSSILSSSLPSPEKPLIAYANVEGEEVAKISARTTDAVVCKGVNLGDIMQVASAKFQGKGGGHDVAAGAQVPIGSLSDFIKVTDELVGKQLKGEKIAS